MAGDATPTPPHVSIVGAFDAALERPIQQIERTHAQLTHAVKQLSHAFRGGNLRDARSLAQAITDRLSRLTEALGACAIALEQYEQTGGSVEEYVREFEAACLAEKVPLSGEFPTYEAFPVEVRFHLDERVVLVNNRTVPLLRPSVVVAYIRRVRDRLHAETFHARRFRQALLRAYDLLSGAPRAPVPLRAIHELLSLRQGGGASGYSLRQFAFDIYRVRQESLVEGKRRLSFIHGRSPRNAVVVPVGGGETENLVALQVQEEP